VAELLALESRGEVKRGGAWLDGEGRGLREALVAEARRRGADVPEALLEGPGKLLLRACLDRAGEAQVRTNPLQRDEAFTCLACGREVPAGGRRPRDHCPWCLAGRHVDDRVPGDRAATCGGLLRAVAVQGGDLLYRCERCGVERRNRVLDDLLVPDDPVALAALAGRAAGPPDDRVRPP